MKQSITKEALAGASSLDGEELTQALLHENQRLLATNESLRRANERGYWLWLMTFIALLVVLFIGALD